jgi:hypothetical protein
MELYLRFWAGGSWILDPVFGFIPEPGRVMRSNAEGHGTGRWTDRGVRGAGPADPAKPPILVLGDSFTEARMVDDDEVYTAVLAKKLADRIVFLHEAKALFFGTYPEMEKCEEPIIQEFLILDELTLEPA